MARRVAPVLLLAFVLAGFSAVGVDAAGAAPAARAGSWHDAPKPPLSRRGLPAIVWTGKEAVVLGGVDLVRGDGRRRPLRDGASFDPGTDEWRRVARAPFVVFSAAWTGNRVFAIGTACPPLAVTAEDTEAFCPSAPLRAATYDPSTDRWTRLTVPKGDVFVVGPASSPQTFGGILAWTVEGAVVRLRRVVSGRFEQSFVLWSPKRGWRELAGPPGHVQQTCGTGRYATALSFDWYFGDVAYADPIEAQLQGGASGSPTFRNVALSVFDEATRSWRASALLPDPAPRPVQPEVTCAGATAIVPGATPDAPLARFDLARGTVHALGPPATGFPSATVLVRLGSRSLAVWDLDRLVPGAQLDLGTGTWTRFPDGPPSESAVAMRPGEILALALVGSDGRDTDVWKVYRARG
jgi:hypothetical protein